MDKKKSGRGRKKLGLTGSKVKAYEDHLNGATIGELAEKYGKHRNTVSQWVEDVRMEVRNSPEWAQAKQSLIDLVPAAVTGVAYHIGNPESRDHFAACSLVLKGNGLLVEKSEQTMFDGNRSDSEILTDVLREIAAAVGREGGPGVDGDQAPEA